MLSSEALLTTYREVDQVCRTASRLRSRCSDDVRWQGGRAQGVRPRFTSPGDTLRRTHGLRLTSRAGPARISLAGERGGLGGRAATAEGEV